MTAKKPLDIETLTAVAGMLARALRRVRTVAPDEIDSVLNMAEALLDVEPSKKQEYWWLARVGGSGAQHAFLSPHARFALCRRAVELPRTPTGNPWLCTACQAAANKEPA